MENRNVSWFGGKGGWLVYLSLIASLRFILCFLPSLSVGQAWNITTLVHAVTSFFLFHWDKGIPFVGMWDQGKYAKLTMWEQLDKEVQYTPTRKLFTLVPIVLFIELSRLLSIQMHSISLPCGSF